MEALLGLLIVAALLGAYLLPSIAASQRRHPSVGGIIVINLFLGWTFLGWVVALAWAMSSTGRGQGSSQGARIGPGPVAYQESDLRDVDPVVADFVRRREQDERWKASR